MTAEQFAHAIETLGLSNQKMAELLLVEVECVEAWAKGALAIPEYYEFVVERIIEQRQWLPHGGASIH